MKFVATPCYEPFCRMCVISLNDDSTMADLIDQIANEGGNQYGTLKNRRGSYRPQFQGSTRFLHAIGELKAPPPPSDEKMAADDGRPPDVAYTAAAHPASLQGQVQRSYTAAQRRVEEPWRREGAYHEDLLRTHRIVNDRPRASNVAPADVSILNFVPAHISTTTAVIGIVVAALLTFLIIRRMPAA